MTECPDLVYKAIWLIRNNNISIPATTKRTTRRIYRSFRQIMKVDMKPRL